MALYHVDVFMPRRVLNSIQPHTAWLRYTAHAHKAAAEDRYGRITLPPAVQILRENIIEVETYTRGLAKLVVRTTYNETHDLVLALTPERGLWIVKTVWLNERGDTHKTLDVRRYERQA